MTASDTMGGGAAHRPYSREEVFSASTSVAPAMLMHSTAVGSVLDSVSLPVRQSGLVPTDDTITRGGAQATAVKKEQGARFTQPSAPRLVMQAIGRGDTCRRSGSAAAGSGRPR